MRNRKIQISIIIIILVAAIVCIPTLASTDRYPKNQNGQSYGTLKIKSLDDAPELIKAQGVDGTIGYVKSSDVIDKAPKTPEDALKQHAEKEAKGSYTVPLYALDGKTVIGEFQMGQGSSSNAK